MKKLIYGSLCLSTTLLADTMIDTIVVKADAIKNSVDKYELRTTKQKDLAEILSNKIPAINHVRNSGIGSDISLRGLDRDNINVTIDGAKIHGACPNRMDPPAMHISSEQIASVEVQEGPFDVASFGAMGGSINVKTEEPSAKGKGSLEYKVGSYGYNKFSMNASGGSKDIQFLFGISDEKSEQYKDGNGDTMVQQIDKIAKMAGTKYKNEYKDLESFDRRTFWSKVNINVAENQKLKLSLYEDDADDVLYPVFGMDAQVDKTTMLASDYVIESLGEYSDSLTFKLYSSKVEHEMGNHFRNASNDATQFRTHAVDSKVKGFKVENRVEDFIIGFDSSERNWLGKCESEPMRMQKQVRIPDVDTKNIALYSKYTTKIDPQTTLSGGIRVDQTEINANDSLLATAGMNGATLPPAANYYGNKTDKDYNNISANIVANFDLGNRSSMFISLGQASRVPDAKELYFIAYDGTNKNWKIQGNPNLKETINREIDIGYKAKIGDTRVKTKAFFSDLSDFIYAYKVDSDTTSFTNINATIYGADLTTSTPLPNSLILDFSVAYQKGEKKDAITSQNDKDLAGITPLKAKLALEYNKINYFAIAEVISANAQTPDKDNGEQDISGYTVVNIKGGYDFSRSLKADFGINNIFDETYAVNNSYTGRGLIGSTGEPMVLNEAGRNFYANLKYSF